MDTDLKDKIVLITGAGGGIGTALVRAFAEEGARPVVHYRTSKGRAEAVADECNGLALQADLTVEDEVGALFSTAIQELGTVDVLVANAGDWPQEDRPLWDMSFERWRSTVAANLDTVFLSCRAFLRHVATTGTGNIVLIGSTAGLIGEAGHADYASAKAAVSGGLLLSLKNEIPRVAATGRVNAVCPGWTQTDMARDALADESALRKITRTMALDKVARPEDIARVVVSLSSDRISGHVTGQVVTVAGGMEGRVLRAD
jgi:3-oxoacyl-[acyl-carrier protein] reductase